MLQSVRQRRRVNAQLVTESWDRMSQKLTIQYGERLRLALKEAPMSVRKLAEEMSGRYGHLRGSSYGGIRQYVGGKIESPRRELLDAFADVLRVRPEWLAFNDGAMTAQEDQVRSALEGATTSERREGEWDWREDIQVVQQEFGDGSDRLADDPLVRMVVLGTWSRLFLQGLVPRLPQEGVEGEAPLSGIANVLAGYMIAPQDPSERRIRYAVGRLIGRTLRAPFGNLPLCPEDLSDSEFLDYVTLICQGIGRLADAHGRKAVVKHTG